MIEHLAFIGDGERAFRLTPSLILELERKRGAGIGAIFKRLAAAEFSLADVSETLRLGLIGGGTLPEEADELIKVYVAERPLGESFPLALTILEIVWFGKGEAASPEAASTEVAP